MAKGSEVGTDAAVGTGNTGLGAAVVGAAKGSTECDAEVGAGKIGLGGAAAAVGAEKGSTECDAGLGAAVGAGKTGLGAALCLASRNHNMESCCTCIPGSTVKSNHVVVVRVLCIKHHSNERIKRASCLDRQVDVDVVLCNVS